MKNNNLSIKSSSIKQPYRRPIISVIYIECENIISASVGIEEKRYDRDARIPEARYPFGGRNKSE